MDINTGLNPQDLLPDSLQKMSLICGLIKCTQFLKMRLIARTKAGFAACLLVRLKQKLLSFRYGDSNLLLYSVGDIFGKRECIDRGHNIGRIWENELF